VSPAPVLKSSQDRDRAERAAAGAGASSSLFEDDVASDAASEAATPGGGLLGKFDWVAEQQRTLRELQHRSVGTTRKIRHMDSDAPAHLRAAHAAVVAQLLNVKAPAASPAPGGGASLPLAAAVAPPRVAAAPPTKAPNRSSVKLGEGEVDPLTFMAALGPADDWETMHVFKIGPCKRRSLEKVRSGCFL
jgi:hypothetical protein